MTTTLLTDLSALNDLKAKNLRSIDQLTLEDLKSRIAWKYMPLHVAVSYGQFLFVKTILKKFPDLVYSVDTTNATLVHVSCFSGQLKMTKFLLHERPSFLDSTRTLSGTNIFHEAVAGGNLEIVKYLLELNPSFLDSSKSISIGVKYDRVDVVKYLIQLRPDLAIDAEGKTLAHLAVEEKSKELNSFMNGIDLFARNISGQTILHTA